ncbi:hypothetical protein [Plantactinospora sonchi]|uniref:Integral membrane protein n=1 Tax=Plantactinospora sonchi TaxID=1544735 RepID=A0ABU7RLL5_9ACTN
MSWQPPPVGSPHHSPAPGPARPPTSNWGGTPAATASWPEPAPSPPAGTPQDPARPGWFRQRWSLLLALLFGLGLLAGSFAAPWLEVELLVAVGRSGPIQSGTTAHFFHEVGVWGYAYLLVTVPLVVLTIIAVLLAGSAWRRWTGVAAAALTLPAIAVIAVANARVNPNGDEQLAQLAALVRNASATGGEVAYHGATDGLNFALLGLLVLGAVAVAAAWPGAGRFTTAVVGTAFVALGVTMPWSTARGITPDSVETRSVGWPAFGGLATLVVVGAVVLTGLVWFAALRRSTAWRLPLLLLSLAVAAVTAIVPDLFPLGGAAWMPAVEREGYLDVDDTVRAAGELIQAAPLVLGTAAVLSWRAARRRATYANRQRSGAAEPSR